MDTYMKTPEIEKSYVDKIGLIDADFIRYIVVYNVSKNVERDPDGKTNRNGLINEILRVLDDAFVSLECKDKIFCLSGTTKNGFRHAISRDREYKGARKARVPLYDTEYEDILFIEEYLKANYHVLKFPDLEADDILSMLQCEDTFIYSKDKDLLQVPGIHFDIKNNEFIEVSPIQSWRFLMKQCLTGDTTDSILGIKGIGEVAAEKIINEVEPKDYHKVVLQKYIEHSNIRQGIDHFVEIYSLLRLTLNRGEYIQQKYAEAFNLLNVLKMVK